MNLKKLINENILLIEDDIREVSEMASKEKSFERILSRMKVAWKPIRLQIEKEDDTHVLRYMDRILERLDEDIGRTNSIACSRFAKFLEGEVKNWLEVLHRMQQNVERWLRV